MQMLLSFEVSDFQISEVKLILPGALDNSFLNNLFQFGTLVISL